VKDRRGSVKCGPARWPASCVSQLARDLDLETHRQQTLGQMSSRRVRRLVKPALSESARSGRESFV